MSRTHPDCTCARGGNPDTCECREVSAARTPTPPLGTLINIEGVLYSQAVILRKINSHDALVAALENIAVSRNAQWSRHVALEALAALKAAKGGT